MRLGAPWILCTGGYLTDVDPDKKPLVTTYWASRFKRTGDVIFHRSVGLKSPVATQA